MRSVILFGTVRGVFLDILGNFLTTRSNQSEFANQSPFFACFTLLGGEEFSMGVGNNSKRFSLLVTEIFDFIMADFGND